MQVAQRFPPISKELMAAVERLYPDTLPARDQTLSIEDLRVKQGEMNVVRLLRRHYDAQNLTILKGS